MNLTQTQLNAKEAYLNNQLEQMLALYEKTNTSERKAIIRHVDGFLSVCSREEKIFWLKFRRKLERINESGILFSLGNAVYTTVGAYQALQESNQKVEDLINMHQQGNWGIVSEDDWMENDFSIKNGFRILSAYLTLRGVKIWIITEADRSSTTILLPSEY